MTDAGAPDRSVRRRRLAAVAIMVTLGAVVVLGGGAATGRLGGQSPRSGLGPPGSSTRRRRPASTTRTRGISPIRWAAGSRHSTATATDGPTSISAVAAARPRCTGTRAGRRSPAVHSSRRSGDRLAGVTGAYPIDMDGDGIGDLMVLRDGENVAFRGLGGCRFQRANEAWGLDGGNLITTAFSATWEGSARLPTLAFGDYLADPRPADPDHLCADNQLVRPPPAADRIRRADPADPIVVRAVDAVQRLGPLGASGPSGQQRPPVLQRPERRPGTAVADRPGQPPRQYTAADGWATERIQGMGIGNYDVNGDGYPDAYLTSQGPNVLQSLLAGPIEADLQGPVRPARRDATRPSTGGDPLPVHRVAP